ncbi:MAG: hypothetical protein IT443_05005 [Phycisphaeraceae bacterium]|nr:hypothetical protein [Phycisphaeraceae bacterium]
MKITRLRHLDDLGATQQAEGCCVPDRVKHTMSRVRAGGVSIIEALLALAISAVLLTATMVATDASFKSYANAVEQASTLTTTRMITHRLLTLIRTGVAQGPLSNAEVAAIDGASINGNEIRSPSMDLQDQQGRLIRLEYRADSHSLWMVINPGDDQQEQALLGGVTSAEFRLQRYKNDQRMLVLGRASLDMTVEADDDAILSPERKNLPSIRVVASTRPRRLD